MGRMLGSFADDQELDRPDLNKCPDCDCFFASDTCPLCKKVCPEEMRAGNRKPVKQKKKRRSSGSGRSYFISWYHRWWFIILMLALFPLVGIILCITSPHLTWKKVLCIAIYLLFPVIISAAMFAGTVFLGEVFGTPLVDDSLTREQYIAACTPVTPEDYYRSPDNYADEYLCIALKIQEQRVIDGETFYICTSPVSQNFVILVRDCLLDGKQNFLPGDLLLVYGQPSDLNYTIEFRGKVHNPPCLNIAYAHKQS